MTIFRYAIRLTAVLAVAVAALPAAAQDVFWDVAGISNYNTDNNWSTDFVPDAAFNERAVINNGGTAFLAAASTTPTGGVTLGQAVADSGTLEVRSGGNLTSQVGTAPAGTPPDGSVIVGAAGTGTLRVLPGGTLSATALISGGNAASSIVLGGTSGAAANVNISGTISLSRTTRVNRNAAVTAGALVFQPESNYIAPISNLGQAIPNIAGTVLLDGRFSVEFTSVTPTVGSSFNLFNAGVVAGAFDSIQVSPSAPLPLGQKWAVTGVPAAGGRQFAQLKLDEFLVLNVNRGTGAVAITNPGTISKSIDAYSILSTSGSLRPATWTSLDDLNALGGNWGEANPNTGRLSEVKAAGVSTFAGGANQPLGIANSFNPVTFGTDTDDITFEYTRSDGVLTSGIVNYSGDPNNLLLTVDPDTGEAQLKNTSPFTVAIDSYSIRSASGLLSTSGWLSLDDQNAAGGNWGEANPNANRLSEVKANGATTLSPGTFFGLGNLLTPSSDPDLQLEFLFDGETVPRIGVVAYGEISTSILGDFDGDGDVDGRDFLVWQRGGSPTPFSASDLAVWQTEYGTEPLSAVTAVPEPTTWLLCMMVGLTLGARRCARFDL